MKLNMKKLAVRLAPFGVMVGALVSGAANAAVDPSITTAITTGTADGSTIAYALLAFAVTIGVIVFIKNRASK